MFRRAAAHGRHYWQLALTFLIILASLVLQLSHMRTAMHWVIIIGSLGIVTDLLVQGWKKIQSGSVAFDVLPVAAIVSAILLHQYWPLLAVLLSCEVSLSFASYVMQRSRRELNALQAGSPKRTNLLRGRKIVEAQVNEVQAGDKLQILPGEVVPVDAVILEGTSSFIEAVLTGDHQPVHKTVGDTILSGAINLDGTLTVRASHAAADSQYQQLVRLVRSAAGQPAPFVRLAERFSIGFMIFAFGIGISMWVLSGQAIRFFDVIVVATPMALLVATPISFISGLSRITRFGIVIRSGSVLEQLANLQTIIFDIRGVLTKGETVVESVSARKPFSEAEVLGLATSLSQAAAHQLGSALAAAALTRHIPISRAKHVVMLSSNGLRATIKGKLTLVGPRQTMESEGVTLSALHIHSAHNLLFVAVDGTLAGIITLKDELRPETPQTIKRLRSLGVDDVVVLTSDNTEAAAALAKGLGITDVVADAKPADKLFALEGYTNRPVAYVGDGLHDAPLLTAADIGIALAARGTAVAIQSAEVVIMRDSLSLVALSIAAARRTFLIAKQGIVVGIGLSLLLMLIFSTGHFSPILGALSAGILNITVLLNALRAHLNKDIR